MKPARSIAFILGLGCAAFGALRAADEADKNKVAPEFAGHWRLIYRDDILGEVPGEAFVSKDEKEVTVTLWDEKHQKETKLAASDLKREGRTLKFTLNGQSPFSDPVKNDTKNMPRLPVAKEATAITATVNGFRTNTAIKPVGRIDRNRVDLKLTFDARGDLLGEWTYHADPATQRDRTGFGRVGAFTDAEEDGKLVGLQTGPEAWERRRPIVQGVVVLEEQLAWRDGKAVYGYPFKRGPKSAEKFAADLNEMLQKQGENDAVKRARAILAYLGDETPFTYRKLLPAGEKIPPKNPGYTRRRLFVYGWNLPKNFDEKLVFTPTDATDKTIEYLIGTLPGSKSNSDKDHQLLNDGRTSALAGKSETEQALIKQMDGILVDAVLKPGVVAGIHTFTVNGTAPATWPLLFGDATGAISFARQKPKDGATENTDGLLAPELAYLEVQTEFEYPIAKIPLQIKLTHPGETGTPTTYKLVGSNPQPADRPGDKPGVFRLEANRLDGRPRVFQTEPFLIYEKGKEALAATEGKEIKLKIATQADDVLTATLDEPRQVLAMPPDAHATILRPKEFGSMWKDALIRAAKTHPEINLEQSDLDHLSSKKATEISNYILLEGLYLAVEKRAEGEWRDWKTLSGPAWLQKKYLESLTGSENIKMLAAATGGPSKKSVPVTCGDHAALLLLRDMFVDMMKVASQRLTVIKTDRELSDARAQLATQLNDESSPFARIRVTPPANYRSWLSDTFNNVISGEFINNSRGAGWLRDLGIIDPKKGTGLAFDTGVPLKWAVSETFLTDYFKQDHAAADAWSRAAVKEGYARYNEAVYASIAKAKAIDVSDVKGLLDLVSYGFEPVTERLLPHLMKLADEPGAGGASHYRWVPDEQARLCVEHIYTLVEAYRAQEEYSKMDTQMVLVAASAATLPVMVWSDAAWAAYLAAAADISMGTATAIESIADLKKNWEAQRFDLGASLVIGISRYDQTVAADPGFWTTVGTVVGGLGPAGLSSWNAVSKYRVAGVLKKLEQGGIAAFRELPIARQKEFLAFAEEAATLRATEGKASLGSTHNRSLAYWDELAEAGHPDVLKANKELGVKPPSGPKGEKPTSTKGIKDSTFEPLEPPPGQPPEPPGGKPPPEAGPTKPPTITEEPKPPKVEPSGPTKPPSKPEETPPGPGPKEPTSGGKPPPEPGPTKPPTAPDEPKPPKPETTTPVKPEETAPTSGGKKETPTKETPSGPKETTSGGKPPPAPEEPMAPPPEKPKATGGNKSTPPPEKPAKPAEPPAAPAPKKETPQPAKPTVAAPEPAKPAPAPEKPATQPAPKPTIKPPVTEKLPPVEFPPEKAVPASVPTEKIPPKTPAAKPGVETVTLEPTPPAAANPPKSKVPKLPEVSETADTVKFGPNPIDPKEKFGLEPGGVYPKDETVHLPGESPKPVEKTPVTEKLEPLEFPPEKPVKPSTPTESIPPEKPLVSRDTPTIRDETTTPAVTAEPKSKVPKLPEVSETAETAKFGPNPIDPKEKFGLDPGGVHPKEETVHLPGETPKPVEKPAITEKVEPLEFPPEKPVAEPPPKTEKLAPVEFLDETKKLDHTAFPPERETSRLSPEARGEPKPTAPVRTPEELAREAELRKTPAEKAAEAAKKASDEAKAAANWEKAASRTPELREIEETVRNGKPLSVDQVMDLKADPRGMRSIKNAPENVREAFIKAENAINLAHDEALINEVRRLDTLDERLQPGVPGGITLTSEKARPVPWKNKEIVVHDFRTPGASASSVNTDRDYRLLYQISEEPKPGGKWGEIPRKHWEKYSVEKFSEVSGYTPDKMRAMAGKEDLAKWSKLEGHELDEAMKDKWHEMHQQLATDKYHPEASFDFSDQQGLWVQKTDEKTGEKYWSRGLTQGEANVGAVKEGAGRLEDAQRFGMMYNEKADAYLRLKSARYPEGDKLEAMAQLNKGIDMLKDMRGGYAKQGLELTPMSKRMEDASALVQKLKPFDHSVTPQQIKDVEEGLRKLGFKGESPLSLYKDRLDAEFHGLNLSEPKPYVAPLKEPPKFEIKGVRAPEEPVVPRGASAEPPAPPRGAPAEKPVVSRDTPTIRDEPTTPAVTTEPKSKVPKLPEVSETAETVKFGEPPINPKEKYGLEPGGVRPKEELVHLAGEKPPVTEKLEPVNFEPVKPVAEPTPKTTKLESVEFPPEKPVPGSPPKTEKLTPLEFPPEKPVVNRDAPTIRNDNPRAPVAGEPKSKVPKLPEVSAEADTVKFGKPPIDPKEKFGLHPDGFSTTGETVHLPGEAPKPGEKLPTTVKLEPVEFVPIKPGAEPLPNTTKLAPVEFPPEKPVAGPLPETRKLSPLEFPPEKPGVVEAPAVRNEHVGPPPIDAKEKFGVQPDGFSTTGETVHLPGAQPRPGEKLPPGRVADEDAPTVRPLREEAPAVKPAREDAPTLRPVREEPHIADPGLADETPTVRGKLNEPAAPGAGPAVTNEPHLPEAGVADETPTVRGNLKDPAKPPAYTYVEPPLPADMIMTDGPPPRVPEKNMIYDRLPEAKADGFKTDGFWYKDPASGKVFYLEKRLGADSTFSQVYTLGGKGNENVVVKFRMNGDAIRDLNPRQMVEEYLQGSKELKNAKIEQVEAYTAGLDGDPPFVIVEKLPPDAKTFSVKEVKTDAAAAGFTKEHRRAVVKLNEKLVKAGLAAEDLHIENIYFVEKEGGGLVAGVLDHDFIKPWEKEIDSKFTDWVEAFPTRDSIGIYSMKRGDRFHDIEEFTAKMFEHKRWIQFDQKTGQFNGKILQIEDFKDTIFEKFLVPRKPSSAVDPRWRRVLEESRGRLFMPGFVSVRLAA